ncbi:NAC domain-containing protein 14 [Brachypodium distachyon]|uniref:NAC domain-containing protein n=1 Tax=Brachypodium distachyon TaxID=15368 RepID=I1I1F0_BRADI|nr:NAC domain-containing protein 14 [Brachypodium distachyon]KQJ95318.1 hypothetical protein BRADI_3g16480v3 [Brachypodium distachyon]|eukprot:XP_010234378.1 NAC domain-containing protein 14 [Brachypodium distachyon]
MTVMELKTLPLGFRFHPTDEELVRHYLKGKITGQINAEVEVIPEIDVCKCEPWDLPDKSLIRSEDPEWFFFAPKDRKYPNGSRSNRATEAGYWKATGKDRIIKSKGEKKKQHMIGMKKTLVFHRGRAPKGERTGWIMHEYRTTEPEFESGEQGGYVLYRLFQKQVEKSERSSPDEMDRSGYSPTPSRSTPDNMEANEEAITLLNKESPESGVQGCPIDLPGTVETPAAPITRWLADRTDNLVTHDANILRTPFHGHVDEIPKTGPLVQPIDPQKKNVDSEEFLTFAAPMLPHEGNDLFCNPSLQGHSFDFGGSMAPGDLVEKFLNEAIADPEEHSSTASKVQYDSDNGIMLPELENNWPMQGEMLDDPYWFENINFCPDDTTPQLSGYENTPLLPFIGANPDELSMDSDHESMQDLFNTMEDSNEKMGGWNNGFGFNPIHQQLQSTMHPNHLVSQQGCAQRRLRLQDSLSAVNIEGEESMTKDEDEVSHIVTSEYMGESVESTADGDDGDSTGVTIMSRHPAPSTNEPSDGDDGDSTGVTIMSRRPAPTTNEPSDGDDGDSTGVTIMSRCPAPSTNEPSDGDDGDSTGVSIISRRPAPSTDEPSDGDDAESTGVLIMSRGPALSSDVPSDRDVAESAGITVLSQCPALSSSSDSSITQQGTAGRRLRLQLNLNAGPCSSIDGSSSCMIDEKENEHKGMRAENEGNMDTSFCDDANFVGNNHADEQDNIPEHDAARPVPEANSVTRLRKTAEKSGNENKQELGVHPHVRAPRKGGFPAYIIWPVLSVALLVLVSVGIYGLA